MVNPYAPFEVGNTEEIDPPCLPLTSLFVKLQVLGLSLGVDFTFALDNNNNNHNDNHNDNHNNPHLNFFKGTVLGVKEQGLGIRDKIKG